MSWKSRAVSVESGESGGWKERAIKPEDESSSEIESGIMHGLQGATGGFLDEIAGGVESAGRVAGVKGLGGSFSDIGLADDGPTLDWEALRDAYKAARDKKRGVLRKQSDDNPEIATTSNIVGSMVSPLNKVTKGMSLAKAGATLGGLNAFGNSESEDLGGMIQDTATGALIGGTVGKAVDVASPYVAKTANYVGEKLKPLAEKISARGLGAERGTIKKLGSEKTMEAGRYALDNGLHDLGLSTDDMIARNEALKKSGGEMMGRAYQAIDDAGASTFNPLEVATKVDEQIGGFYRSPINRGETNQLENTLESILMRGDKNIPLSEAQALKQELGKVANWKNNINITDKEKMAREAYKIISTSIDDAVKKGSEAVNKAGLSETLSKGKDLFSKASTAEELLANKLAREDGNKFIGLTDAITGGAALGYGGMTGDWQTGLGIMAGKKGLEKYGAKIASRSLDKVSKALMKSPQMAALFESNPQAFQALANKLEQGLMSELPRAAEKQQDEVNKPPDKNQIFEKVNGSKYSGVLQKALERGEDSFNAAHFILSSRDPDYRKTLEENK